MKMVSKIDLLDMYGIFFNSSSQNWEILMASLWPTTPSADILWLLACVIIWLRKSGWTVLMILKKYSRPGPLPTANWSGKYLETSSSP